MSSSWNLKYVVSCVACLTRLPSIGLWFHFITWSTVHFFWQPTHMSGPAIILIAGSTSVMWEGCQIKYKECYTPSMFFTWLAWISQNNYTFYISIFWIPQQLFVVLNIFFDNKILYLHLQFSLPFKETKLQPNRISPSHE